LKTSTDAVEFATETITVRITTSPLRVIFLDSDGSVILQDDPAHPPSWNGGEFRMWKSMPLDEHYFGLGDKAGPIDHRDQAFTMWNTDAYGWSEGTDPLYKSVPFFLAVRRGKAYGVFLGNTFRTSFDFGKQSRDYYSFGSDGGDLDYYFIYGPEPKAVIESFTALVGRMPLPPRFALGYHQSRYSYFPESRVREVAHEFRVHKIPCDAIYLDIDYQDGNRAFTIDRSLFPSFEGMIRDLAKDGFKLVTITDPHIKKEPGYKPYDEGMAHDYFVHNPDGSVYVGEVWPGESVFPDFTRDEVREWFGTLYTGFVHMGIRGFWDDMNEPAVFRYPEKTMPLETVHRIDGRKTTHREVHNVYGMQNARATYEGVSRLNRDLRPFVLTRAAFAGTERYAAAWTGDNSATWTHYRLTLPTLLNLSVSGYPLVGVDVGGFAGSPTPELLTRWTELGAFIPLFRNHADKGTRDREPWVDGPEHEAIRRRYIETRYRLMPYIYTSIEESTRTGVPLMRPMFFEFVDEAVQTTDSEYMFGHDLLIAPKLFETVDALEVKLPEGTWYDFWSGTPVDGGTTLKLHPALDQLPVFVRGGAIIPEQSVVQNVDEIPHGPLELHVYPGQDCRGSLYSDDGNTMAYTRGEFLHMRFSCDAEPNSLRITIGKPEGALRPWWQSIELSATMFAAPREVSVNAQPVTDWKFDASHKSLVLTVPAPSANTDVVIRY
jgi:alpha-glucosidase